MLVAGCTLASCDKDNKKKSDTEVVNYDLTLYASDPSENESAITDGWNWKSGDQLVFFNLTYTRNLVTLINNGANFTGSVPSVASSAKIGFFYPKSALTQTASDISYVKLRYRLQDGVNVQSYLAGTCVATINGTAAEAKVNMKLINAAAKMNFTYQGKPINEITHIEVYSDKEALLIGGDYELKTLSFNAPITGNIAVDNAGLNGSAKIGLFPCNGVRLCVSVTTADGKVYLGKQENSVNIKAGDMLNLNYDCECFDSKAKIGDYFYTDFTYSTEYDDTKDCVGVIFALSDKKDGDINRTLTTGSHGRVMSLTDITKYAWAFNGTYAIDMPKLTNYADADGSNAYGYLPFHVTGGNIGYYEEADKKIDASIDHLGNITKWPTSGALSDFNGKHNTESVDSASNKYPAGYYASRFNKGGITTWYMPSAGEMALMYALHRSGIIANQEGFVGLKEFGYWTSTECTEQKSWVLQAFDGKVYPNFKTSVYIVRPVTTF